MSLSPLASVIEIDPTGDEPAPLHHKQDAARRIALRSGVLRECAVHHQVFYDDQDPKRAFELMLELLHGNAPELMQYKDYLHELLDILTQVIADTPPYCSECRSSRISSWEAIRAT